MTKATSVRLDTTSLEQIKDLASREERSINKMIDILIREALRARSGEVKLSSIDMALIKSQSRDII